MTTKSMENRSSGSTPCAIFTSIPISFKASHHASTLS